MLGGGIGLLGLLQEGRHLLKCLPFCGTITVDTGD
jgi:hypothetical protein